MDLDLFCRYSGCFCLGFVEDDDCLAVCLPTCFHSLSEMTTSVLLKSFKPPTGIC